MLCHDGATGNPHPRLRVAGERRAIIMQITNFKDMDIAELQELVNVEGQFADELLRMAEVASHPSLKDALMHHREETLVQG